MEIIITRLSSYVKQSAKPRLHLGNCHYYRNLSSEPNFAAAFFASLLFLGQCNLFLAHEQHHVFVFQTPDALHPRGGESLGRPTGEKQRFTDAELRTNGGRTHESI